MYVFTKRASETITGSHDECYRKSIMAYINPLPDYKKLAWFNFKEFTKTQTNLFSFKTVSFLRYKTLWKKEKSCFATYFFLFSQCFQRVFFPQTRLKSPLCFKGSTLVILIPYIRLPNKSRA